MGDIHPLSFSVKPHNGAKVFLNSEFYIPHCTYQAQTCLHPCDINSISSRLCLYFELPQQCCTAIAVPEVHYLMSFFYYFYSLPWLQSLAEMCNERKTFFIIYIFEALYFLELCLIFVNSVHINSKRGQPKKLKVHL